jgi:hypothetical protein
MDKGLVVPRAGMDMVTKRIIPPFQKSTPSPHCPAYNQLLFELSYISPVLVKIFWEICSQSISRHRPE